MELAPWISAIVVVAGIFSILCLTVLILNHLRDIIRLRIIARYEAAKVWAEAYQQGADDERQAIEWDIPEYSRAARQNPYGDPESLRSRNP